MSYDEYLSGKSVALVGPAPTVIEVENNVDIINSHDIIVRLNRALPIHKDLINKIGSRTEVLYNCLDEDPESGGYLHIPYLAQQVDWIIGAYPLKSPFKQNIVNFQSRNSGRINFDFFDLDYYEHLEESMGTRPNTGILTMLDLLTRDIKRLYITGFTFFKGGYIRQYRDYTEEQVMNRMKTHGNHHQEPQFRYVKDLLLNDDRVMVDDFMLDILKGDKL